jgi:excisionase family DNA binding protein
MTQIILNGIELNDLLDKIATIVEDKIRGNKPAPPKSGKYLSRNEVCDLLKISLPTLNDWTKIGRLQSYKIGNRVLYKQGEIETALESLATYKFKRGAL